MHDKIFSAPFPADRIGRPLKVGDKVIVLCEITELLQAGNDPCNVIVETAYSRPDGSKAKIALSTAVMDLADYSPPT